MNSSTPKHSKQILYVWDYLEWGGVQIYFLSLMRQVSKFYNVKAILPLNSEKKLLSYLESNNVEFVFFESKLDFSPAKGFFKKIIRKFSNFICNYKLILSLEKQDLKNSIIQIDVTPWTNFLLLLYLSFRTNVFVTFHTPLPKISNARKVLWKIKFSIFSRIKNINFYASNYEVKKSLSEFLTEKKFSQIQIIYPSFNNTEINKIQNVAQSREEIAVKYEFDSNKFWLCNVGQFIDRKGCWILLETLKEITKTNTNIFCYWLGTKDISTETKSLIKTYGLDNHFRFLSSNEIGDSREDLLNLLNVSDLFVMPSLEEGLPVALIEAFALGKCCVASNINAIPEAIRDNETGILVDANNVTKLCKAIQNIIENKKLRQNCEVNSKKFALYNFDEERNGKIMLSEYQKSFNES